MITLIIILLIALFFVFIIFYSLFGQRKLIKDGRQVNVQILSCESSEMYPGQTDFQTHCYTVTGEFCKPSGESITKTIQSDIPFIVGSTIPSIYVDEKDHLLLNQTKSDKKPFLNAMLILFVVISFVIIIVATIFMETTDNETIHTVSQSVIAFGVGILFSGIGILRLIIQKKQSKDLSSIQVFIGTQVNYQRTFNRSEITYSAIYEYMLDGTKCLYHSPIGGTARKYKQTGRKVHIERNFVTGEVRCREDEEPNKFISIMFTIIGLLYLVLITTYSIFS